MVAPAANLRSSKRASTRTSTTQTPSSSTTSLASSTPSGRVTRLRAAKERPSVAGSGASLTRTNTAGSGILARSKEGLRNISDKMNHTPAKSRASKVAAVAKGATPIQDGYTESLQAFLRIRPPPTEDATQAASQPYLEIKDEQRVVMTAPPDGNRHHLPKPPHTYSFDRVFGPEAQQHQFFRQTTLPLVEKLLQGDNGLMFAYGVSNSGKTYTIQGGNSVENGVEERGVLPRAIDVVFNSISGLESKANLKCQGLADVVLTDEPDAHINSFPTEAESCIDDSVKVDRNFSYAVFVSYAEVYNEKVFDLLDSVLPAARPAISNIPRTMSMGVGLSSGIGSSMTLAAMANGGAGVLKRRALVLKNDPEGTGKYISGLNEIRVRTREEALTVFRSGQRARQVFGTMANRESSRSHGIFTLKVVRIHNGAPHDPESAQVSRLAIVDLAGSERTRNTASSGDRLKEAGNINKSLMVLGQCIEVLRANQQRMNTPPSLGHKRRLAVVPFRHSKLTEIFQSFFVGDGRAVMIVHVNPYDTGFDENSNVMKFSAVAQEISTVHAPRTFPALKKQISSQFSALRNAVSGQKIRVMVPVIAKAEVTPVNVNVGSSFSRPTAASAGRASTSNTAPVRAPPRASRPVSRANSRHSSRATSPVEEEPAQPVEEITVVEEEIEVVEEEPEEEEDDDRDYLVDYLFEELRQLKTQLYESEMRNAAVEMQIREEVARDMQQAIHRMHSDFNRRLQEQNALGDEKADKKIDIMHRTMGAGEDTSFEDSFMTEDSNDTMSVHGNDDPFNSVPIHAPRVSSSDAEMSFATAASGNLDVSISIDDSRVEDSLMEDNEDEEGDESRADESRVEGNPDETLLSASDEEGSEEGSEGEVDSDEEDEEEEEEEEEEEDDEDDEESEEDESASEFEESFTEDQSISSVASSPPRRNISPAKRSTPRATPKAKSTPQPSASKPKALRDSNVQQLINLVSSDDEVVVKGTPAKKKRALGKKVITADEIEAADERGVAGAEVRRMVRGV